MVRWSPTVPSREIHGTRRETTTMRGSYKGTVQLECDWDRAYDLAYDIIGNSRPWPFGNTGMYPTTADIEPMPTEYSTDLDEEVIVYKKGIVSMTWETLDSGQGSGGPGTTQLYSETLSPTLEMLRRPGKNFRWKRQTPVRDEDGFATGKLENVFLTDEEAPGIPFRGLTLSRTLFNMAYVPNDILLLSGKSNLNTYYSAPLRLFFDKGTLMFTPPTMSRSINIIGGQQDWVIASGWNVNVQFMYKPQGWNRFYREALGNPNDPNAFDTIQKVDSIQGVFNDWEPVPEADMSNWIW